MKNLKIVVLCGGLSTERNISFLSGSKICAALRSRGHRAVLADLYLGFDEEDSAEGCHNAALQNGKGTSSEEKVKEALEAGGRFDPETLFSSLPPIPDFKFDGHSPDLEAVRRSRKWKSPSLFGKHVLELCQAADIVFIALHGKNGEDGSVQAAFDMLGIPYTGSGHLGAAMAMDKMITKMIVSGRGVRTPAFRRWDYLPQDIKVSRKESKPETENGYVGQEDPAADRTAESEDHKARERFIRSVCRQTDVPCVVKTPDGGSSVGVYIVHEKKDLADAVRGCLAYGSAFMVEQYIDGREFTCGVLCGRALPSVEIVPKTRFYDYSNKYAAGATEEICPGRVSPEIEREMGRTALQVHEIMDLSTYSRSDFMIDKEGQVWFIEVNTLPGMTNTSLVPQEAAAVGIGYEELCEKIVEDALRIRGTDSARGISM